MAGSLILAEDIAAAFDMETRITRLYRDAVAQSKCLMADVPRVTERVVKTRTKRQDKLKVIATRLGQQ